MPSGESNIELAERLNAWAELAESIRDGDRPMPAPGEGNYSERMERGIALLRKAARRLLDLDRSDS